MEQACPPSLKTAGSAQDFAVVVLNPKSAVAPGARARFQSKGLAVTVRPLWTRSALQVWPIRCPPGKSQLNCQAGSGAAPVLRTRTVTVEPPVQACDA